MDIETRFQRDEQVTTAPRQSSTQVVSLQTLKVGQSATVVELLGSEQTVKCLEERGLRPSARIHVIVAGPAAVCQVGDQRLSLRICGHCEVLVRLEG
jgi:Fe2+ transport system protein FeoA